MRVAILRRTPKASVSMDVYADRLIDGLKTVRPTWEIFEFYPTSAARSAKPFQWISGVQKYYERYWRYPHRLQQFNADIFHIIDHSDGYLSSWLRNAQRPNVVTCHDLINLIRPDTFKGRARFPLVSMTAWRWGVEGMRQANHILSVSSHTKKDTVEHLGISPETITVVPNAVDQVFHSLSSNEVKDVRHRYGLTDQTWCLLNVGSNNFRKNVSGILTAVDLLKSQGIPVHFWKVGTDFNQEQKQFIQSHGLTSCVTYLGQPDKTDLIEIYNAADCLMAPSFYEGFGLTILESMACGTPVITANVTAMPEVAGNAAILVDPTNIEAIANAALYLYGHPDECASLSQKGLDHVREFTWELTAEQVAQVYEQVMQLSSSELPIESLVKTVN